MKGDRLLDQSTKQENPKLDPEHNLAIYELSILTVR